MKTYYISLFNQVAILTDSYLVAQIVDAKLKSDKIGNEILILNIPSEEFLTNQ